MGARNTVVLKNACAPARHSRCPRNIFFFEKTKQYSCGGF
jgi:hypothetical protein